MKPNLETLLSRTIYGVNITWVRTTNNGVIIDQWFELNGRLVQRGAVNMENFNALITMPKSWYQDMAKRYPI